MATNNLDKLTKSIDALTYNSRSVLNALIRSCMAAGSSTGYTIRRYGKEIVLDRTDIYKLYDFYQTWANGTMGYDKYTNDADEFNAILSACNAKWSGTDTVTAAVVKHAQTIYTTETNVKNDNPDYWTNLIRTSTAPKVIVNSAPIPLNLRTPLYDENLSTKSFSQYETYLFPMGYYQSSILGTPGDGEERVAAGKTWFFDVDEQFKVNAPRVMFGVNSNPVSRQENYRGSKYTISYGTESYALANNTLAGGSYVIASGLSSAAVGGYGNLALSTYSFIGGGYNNFVVGDYGAIAGGMSNRVTGTNGFAANKNSYAGDISYEFVVEEASSAGNTSTNCSTIVDTVTGVCIASSASNAITQTTGRDTIRIKAADVASTALSAPRLASGDRVVIYAQTRKYNGITYESYQKNGYTYPAWYYEITRISQERSTGDWLITLSGNLPSGESFNSIWANGGTIARQSAVGYETKFNGNIYASKTTMHYGDNSTALNFNTVAAGYNQTVVGQMNVPNIDAKFVVGVGSSYVSNGAMRRNGFVVAHGYSYMQTANRNAIIGVSEYDGVYYRDYDGNNIRHGSFMMYDDGKYAGETTVFSYHTRIGLRKVGTNAENNMLQFCQSGSGYISKDYDVTTMLESRAGALVISSGSYTSSTYNVDVLLGQGNLRGGENGLAIYSEDGMDIRNTNSERSISIHNSGYITMTFKGLRMDGDTWGTFAGDSDSRSHWVYHNANNDYRNPYSVSGRCVDYPNVIAHSGFFYSTNGWQEGKTPAAGRINLPKKVDGSNWEAHQGRGMHIINSAVSYINGYDVSCLVLPGYVKEDEVNEPPHPKFINSFIYGTGNNGIMPTETYVTEELAYMSDVKKYSTISGTSYINTGCTAYISVWDKDGNLYKIGDDDKFKSYDREDDYGIYMTEWGAVSPSGHHSGPVMIGGPSSNRVNRIYGDRNGIYITRISNVLYSAFTINFCGQSKGEIMIHCSADIISSLKLTADTSDRYFMHGSVGNTNILVTLRKARDGDYLYDVTWNQASSSSEVANGSGSADINCHRVVVIGVGQY